MALRPDPTDYDSSSQYRRALDRYNAEMAIMPASTAAAGTVIDPTSYENTSQYQNALVNQRLADMTSPEQTDAFQAANALGLGIEEYAAVKPQLDAQAAARAKQDEFMASPEVVNAVNVFKANPNDENAWRGLADLLANAPVNYSEMGDPTARQAKYGTQEFNAGADVVNKYPEIKDAFYAAGERFNPQGGMLSMQNLGPALAVGGLALGAGALGTAMAGTGAGALTGSAAAPFGYAGSTGVGANLATAAGLPGALGAAGAAVPNVASTLSNLAQTPTPPLSTAPSGTPAIGSTPSVSAMPASPAASTAIPSLGTMGAGSTVPAIAGAVAPAAGSLIDGISNSDLLNLGGTAISGGLGAYAAGQAADTQSQGAQAAIDLQREMYNQSRADIAPWREAGVANLAELQTQMPELTRQFGMSDFQADPGAQYRREMGRQERENWAGQTGNIYSGEALLEADRQGQGLASQEYGNAYNRYVQNQGNTFNRLASMANVGQTATNQLGAYGQNMAANVGNNITSQAAANAAGQMGQANALSGAIGSGLSMYNQQQQNQQNLAMQNKWLGAFSGGA